jgi:hypothetical protein
MEIVYTRVLHLHLISLADQVLGMVLLVLIINKTQTQHVALVNIGMVTFV